MTIDIWVIFSLAIAVIGALLGILYKRTSNNSRRIGMLEVSLGRLESIPHVIEKHEGREDKQFDAMNQKLERIEIRLTKIALDVAVIKKNGSLEA